MFNIFEIEKNCRTKKNDETKTRSNKTFVDAIKTFKINEFNDQKSLITLQI